MAPVPPVPQKNDTPVIPSPFLFSFLWYTHIDIHPRHINTDTNDNTWNEDTNEIKTLGLKGLFLFVIYIACFFPIIIYQHYYNNQWTLIKIEWEAIIVITSRAALSIFSKLILANNFSFDVFGGKGSWSKSLPYVPAVWSRTSDCYKKRTHFSQFYSLSLYIYFFL